MLTYYIAVSAKNLSKILRDNIISDDDCSYSAFKTPGEALSHSNDKRFHQVFLLKIELCEIALEKELVLKSIEKKSVKQFIVYSQRAKKLFNNLKPADWGVDILVEPSFFDQDDILDGIDKKEQIKPVAPSPLSEDIDNFDECLMGRISTYEEHVNLLKKVFQKAKKTILITSYHLSEETFEKADLYQLIPQALSRSSELKIYIYYNDQKEDHIPINIKQFLHQFSDRVIFNVAYTHSKILGCDKNFVAIGSCNWLSIYNKNYPESDEGTFFFSGEDLCVDILKDCWNHLRYYRNLQFYNKKAINRFNNNEENLSTCIYDLDQDLNLEYLPTLEQNLAFFKEVFDVAQKRIIICSPFISSHGSYEYDININLLRKTVSRGVDIYFVCSKNSNSLKYLDAFLAEVASPKIRLIPADNIHLKTIIIDDCGIAEGSFNWLSASREEDSDYHNHEQTFYIRGAGAEGFIHDFFSTRLGLALKKELEKPLAPFYQRAVNNPIAVRDRSRSQLSRSVFTREFKPKDGLFVDKLSSKNNYYPFQSAGSSPFHGRGFFNTTSHGRGHGGYSQRFNPNTFHASNSRGKGRGASFNKKSFYPRGGPY